MIGNKHDRKLQSQHRRTNNALSPHSDVIGYGQLAKYITGELSAGKAPTVSIKAVSERCGAG